MRFMLPARYRLGLFLCTALALLPRLPAADTARHGLIETALDRYVAAPDTSFAWKKTAEFADETGTAYVLDVVSQAWLTPAAVNRTEWRHALVIAVPKAPAPTTALLMIGGGSNRPGNPPRPSQTQLDIARATQSVVAELRIVPNQPLVFQGDGVERSEDAIIAYTWDHYLRTGDQQWPARLPMTKAAVRAMDAVTEFLASEGGGRVTIDSFVVAGGSKRGWTTWTTAAVDRRVIGICPMVFDMLNLEASFTHHYRVYGFFAPAVGDYVRQHIMDWLGTREIQSLFAIEDPLSYRDRLTMPKLIINAAGDQFSVPDSSQFYFTQLEGPKYLRYIPNVDHGMKNSDAFQTLRAWHAALLKKAPLPQFSWKRDTDGGLTVTTKTTPAEVKLWQVTNPAARDFRLETIGATWQLSPVEGKSGTYHAAVAKPAQGWCAFFVELTFDIGVGTPLKLTTDVVVTPDTYPFAAPTPAKVKGFLSGEASARR